MCKRTHTSTDVPCDATWALADNTWHRTPLERWHVRLCNNIKNSTTAKDSLLGAAGRQLSLQDLQPCKCHNTVGWSSPLFPVFSLQSISSSSLRLYCWMVWFTCEACNDTVKKPKLGGHRCNAKFTCVDCCTTFDREGAQVRALALREGRLAACMSQLLPPEA